MNFRDGELRLTGRHFLVNIAQPENLPSGLLNVNRDPRRQKRKPDAYVGVVEEAAPGCLFVKSGDRIVFRRWEYEQMDVDDERLIADEEDLIVLNGEEPAPGIIIMQLIEEPMKTSLVLPDTLRPAKRPMFKGEVICHSLYRMGPELKNIIKNGIVLYFQRSDSDQWHYGNGRIAVKMSGYFEVTAYEEKEPVFEVV